MHLFWETILLLLLCSLCLIFLHIGFRCGRAFVEKTIINRLTVVNNNFHEFHEDICLLFEKYQIFDAPFLNRYRLLRDSVVNVYNKDPLPLKPNEARKEENI